MKRFVACLLLCLCIAGFALGESATPALIAEVSFEPQEITIDELALGFLIPSDYVLAPLDGSVEGLLVDATAPDRSLHIVVTIEDGEESATLASLTEEGANSLMQCTVNDIPYLLYTLPDENTGVALTFLAEDRALIFRFTYLEGVADGGMTEQVLGSLFDL